jgi:protein TonB
LVAGEQVPPRYPSIARRRAWQGTVVLELSVRADGTVAAVKLRESSGYDVLDQEAIRVAREWRYEPGTRDGKPVAEKLLQPVEFRLR